MTTLSWWHRGVSAAIAVLALSLAGCSSPPAFQVSEQAVPRVGTVEFITQDQVQTANSALSTVGGALIGGGLGSLIGGGSGQTVATVVGAIGGGYAGNRIAANSTTNVWRIGVRYDDGSLATIQQTSSPGLRIGDRVRVSSTGIELLR
jgi:outer membrane lipoprotein SlyB